MLRESAAMDGMIAYIPESSRPDIIMKSATSTHFISAMTRATLHLITS